MLLDSQKPEGYWNQRDYYLPKHTGTFWVLSILGEMGLTNASENIRRGCEFMFSFQRTDGGFYRKGNFLGQDQVWDNRPEPCTHARIVRFLIQFGYRSDPRTHAAIDWLLSNQRPDGMWLCNYTRNPKARTFGCLRATLDFLRVAVLDVDFVQHPATRNAARAVAEVLLEPRMDRYHVGDQWFTLTYPYYGYGLIPGLDALARLGFSCDHPKIARSVDFLLSRRLPDGTWLMDELPVRSPMDFGRVGESNPWLTLEALVALKQLGISLTT
jgi:hypothetical protein